MKSRIVILHFMPIEGYPPVQNLLHILDDRNDDIKCFTTNGNFTYQSKIENCQIIRFGNSKTKLYLSYILFNIWGLIRLIIFKPQTVLYYETLSSFPALVYKKIFPKTKLLIHYHEYTTIKEYATGSKVSRWLHRLEKKCYPLAHTFSQTNEERMMRFCKDNNLVRDNRFLIIPNYPPKSWHSIALQRKKAISPYKMVYVGYTLNNETMFVDEIFHFIKQHNEFILDCYLGVVTEELSEKTKNITDRITIYTAISNKDIPNILINYSIGLILYRGHIPNYVYNATNKLFEYLSCDLNVWFPKQLKGSYPYITNGTYPKVIKLDFEKLDEFNLEELISRDGLKYQPTNYYAEDAFEELITQLQQ